MPYMSIYVPPDQMYAHIIIIHNNHVCLRLYMHQYTVTDLHELYQEYIIEGASYVNIQNAE